MRMLFLGDVVGRPGREAVTSHLPGLVAAWKLDFVAVNGENAAGGFGITESIYEDFRAAGADVVTLGNHSFDQREALVFIERATNLVRPINYPPGTPGRGAVMAEAKNGANVLVLNIMGRTFMDPLDDPFSALDKALEGVELGRVADAVIVDFHAEATSEKQAFGHYCDGRASLVVGTHTHVPTADHRILSGGTGYMTDVGMCGSYDGVIGMDKEEPIRRFTRKLASGRFEPATGPGTLSGVAVETDDSTGLAVRIAPVRIGGALAPARPDFWDA